MKVERFSGGGDVMRNHDVDGEAWSMLKSTDI